MPEFEEKEIQFADLDFMQLEAQRSWSTSSCVCLLQWIWPIWIWSVWTNLLPTRQETLEPVVAGRSGGGKLDSLLSWFYILRFCVRYSGKNLWSRIDIIYLHLLFVSSDVHLLLLLAALSLHKSTKGPYWASSAPMIVKLFDRTPEPINRKYCS